MCLLMTKLLVEESEMLGMIHPFWGLDMCAWLATFGGVSPRPKTLSQTCAYQANKGLSGLRLKKDAGAISMWNWQSDY